MNFPSDSIPIAQNQMPDLGELGEQLVAEWLRTKDWQILHHRWRCRWGEIDLIACSGAKERDEDDTATRRHEDMGNLPRISASPRLPLSASTNLPVLAFVEVKTRSRGNWDANGLLALTPTKQAKLWQTAELFLAEHPDFATIPCRFDVALVSCQRISGQSRRNQAKLTSFPVTIDEAIQSQPIQLGQPILVAGYRLILQDYIQSAFD